MGVAANQELLTSPSIFAIVVKFIQIFQVLRIDDGWTWRPFSRPTDGLRRQSKGSAYKAVLLLHVTATPQTINRQIINRSTSTKMQMFICLLDSFWFDGILPKNGFAVKSWRGCNSGGYIISTRSVTRLFWAHLQAEPAYIQNPTEIQHRYIRWSILYLQMQATCHGRQHWKCVGTGTARQWGRLFCELVGRVAEKAPWGRGLADERSLH